MNNIKLKLKGIVVALVAVIMITFGTSCVNKMQSTIKNDYFEVKYPLGWTSTKVTTNGGVQYQLFRFSPEYKNKENALAFTIIITDTHNSESSDSLPSQIMTFAESYKNNVASNDFRIFNKIPMDLKEETFKDIKGIGWKDEIHTETSVNDKDVSREDIDQTYFAYTDRDKLIIIQYQYDTKNEKENKGQIQKVIDQFVPTKGQKI